MPYLNALFPWVMLVIIILIIAGLVKLSRR